MLLLSYSLTTLIVVDFTEVFRFNCMYYHNFNIEAALYTLPSLTIAVM